VKPSSGLHFFMQDLNHLLVLLKKGNALAQRQLFDLYKSRLLGLSYRYTNNRDDAQDVLQDSFIKIFSKISQIESANKLDSWMRQITVRTAINFYHKKNLRECRVDNVDLDPANDDYEYLLSAIADGELMGIINGLPLGCKIIFNLHAIEGFSHDEIAEMMKISPGTSRSQFHYGKNLLKLKLKKIGIVRYEKFA
jgi:RNA polymerase sigma factor (sigma-70 family)